MSTKLEVNVTTRTVVKVGVLMVTLAVLAPTLNFAGMMLGLKVLQILGYL